MVKRNKMKLNLYGLDVIITKDNIHIENSYILKKKKKIKSFLEDLWRECLIIETPFNHRTINSMVNEWIAHNNLYKLNYKTDRTKDCDLNWPQKWYVTLAYWLISRIVL